MAVEMQHLAEEQAVPQAVIRALFRQPWTLQTVLAEAGLAPHELAVWARRLATGSEIEKLAGWLAVGQRPGEYKPLLEVATSHLRAGEVLEALPVFRWAYQAWQAAPPDAAHRGHGVRLLARWGQCLYQAGQVDEAVERWRWALSLVADETTLRRLLRVVEEAGAAEVGRGLLDLAVRRGLPGAEALRHHRHTLQAAAPTPPALPTPPVARPTGVAVLADVANLDQVCAEQYGFGQRVDYGRLLRSAERHGTVRVRQAFVPDIPETLAVQRHLAEVGFDVELQRLKRTHGRLSANADAHIAAAATRWASDPSIQRVELWTGDGDFLKVRDVIGAAWPTVNVVFRGFAAGTAQAIQHLEGGWLPITGECLQ